MHVVFLLGLAVGLAVVPPLEIDVAPVRGALEVRMQLREPLPSAFTDALPSGALVRVAYPVSVRSRRWLIWDRRIWKGNVTSQVAFDPITGRYRCELMLDEIVVESREVETAELAKGWLCAPPPVRLVLDDAKNLDKLYVRARALFSSSTTLLVFPNTEGTDWVSVPVIKDESGVDSAPE